jgi:hypothetical protein
MTSKPGYSNSRVQANPRLELAPVMSKVFSSVVWGLRYENGKFYRIPTTIGEEFQ